MKFLNKKFISYLFFVLVLSHIFYNYDLYISLYEKCVEFILNNDLFGDDNINDYSLGGYGLKVVPLDSFISHVLNVFYSIKKWFYQIHERILLIMVYNGNILLYQLLEHFVMFYFNIFYKLYIDIYIYIMLLNNNNVFYKILIEFYESVLLNNGNIFYIINNILYNYISTMITQIIGIIYRFFFSIKNLPLDELKFKFLLTTFGLSFEISETVLFFFQMKDMDFNFFNKDFVLMFKEFLYTFKQSPLLIIDMDACYFEKLLTTGQYNYLKNSSISSNFNAACLLFSSSIFVCVSNTIRYGEVFVIVYPPEILHVANMEVADLLRGGVFSSKIPEQIQMQIFEIYNNYGFFVADYEKFELYYYFYYLRSCYVSLDNIEIIRDYSAFLDHLYVYTMHLLGDSRYYTTNCIDYIYKILSLF